MSNRYVKRITHAIRVITLNAVGHHFWSVLIVRQNIITDTYARVVQTALYGHHIQSLIPHCF